MHRASLLSYGRDEATRTPDPYVPNVVRYQLRYIPKAFSPSWAKSGAKVCLFCDKHKFLLFFLTDSIKSCL